MKSIKRTLVILLVMLISLSVVSLGAEALNMSVTMSDYGYMVPTDNSCSKELSTAYLYGNCDYLNFYIKSLMGDRYFFFEIYSDKNCNNLIYSDYTYCSGAGDFIYSPYIKLVGLLKSGTYYCVTYSVRDYGDEILISKSSVRSFKLVVNRLPKYNQQIVGLKSVTNTVDGPQVKWYSLSSTVKYNIYRRPLVGTKWEKIGTVNGSTYEFTDKSVKNKNGRYVYTVRGVDKNGTLTRYHYSGVTAHYAKTPVVSSVSTVVDNRVQIKWNSTGSTAVYQIYRMENDGGWELLKKEHKGTVFYDETARSGNKYRYTVRAVIKTNTGTALSHFYNGKTVTYIAAPELNPLKFTENGMNVTWQASEGAVKYAVYRKPLDENKNWRLIGKVDSKTTAFVDTTAVKEENYLYTVRSEGANFQGSYLGKGVEYFNLVPPDFKVDVKDNKITLSWDSVPYADSYEVYGKFAGDDYGWHYLKNSKVCTYEIAPKTYTDVIFAVRSVRGNTKSAYKYSDNVTVFPFIEPNYVVYKDYIRLYWNSAEVDSYNIYRKLASDPDSEYELIANTAKTKYDDKTAQYDVMYEYSVRGVKNSVEQSTNLTSKIITKYSPEKYIKEFDSYIFASYSDSYYDCQFSNDKLVLEKVLTPEGEKLRTGYYTLDRWGWKYVLPSWDLIDVSSTNTTVAIVVYDENGKTPIDAFIKKVDYTTCECPELSMNVKPSAVDFFIGYIDGAKEYKLSEYQNEISRIIEPFASNKKVISIPISEFRENNNISFKISVRRENGNITERIYSGVDVFNTYPRMMAVIRQGNANVVTWTFDESWEAGRYEFVVFRKTPGDSNWKQIGIVDPLYDVGLQFYDSTAKAGVKYFYTVRTYHKMMGSYASYYDTKGMQVGKLATPKLYSATNVSDGIALRWENNSAAQGYCIYRKTANTGWTKIDTVERANAGYETFYIDETANKGITYYYTVRTYAGPVMSGYDSVGVKCKKS